MEIFQNKRKKIFKRISLTLLFLILLLLSFAAGMYAPGVSLIAREAAMKEVRYTGKILDKYGLPRKGELSDDVRFDLFWDVWDTMKEEYVDKDRLNEKEMFYGAIKGMVASAGDPYTVFMDPKIAQEFADDLAGTFDGIGAEIAIRDDILTVVAPLSGSPAEKSGLKAGDKIFAINGTSTAGITVEEAVGKIRGQKGTTVTLTILHEGSDKTDDYVITRDKIVIKSVKTEMKGNGIFVITISNFNNDTAELFGKAVNEAVRNNPKGIILDIRNNPGGYLETAIDVASAWIDEGVIVSERFSDDKKNDFFPRGRARLKDFKTIVLINQGSASASEIVAGALKDGGKAALVGKKTFGKGSVQTLDEFSDGSTIKITIAEWLTPKGYNINDEGIDPDVEVNLEREDFENDRDPQMEKAMEILNPKH
jgi:carboxyl-terminal processing protease